jgi:hypothetical protein
MTVDQINELERASRYLQQQLTAAKNAITSLAAMEQLPEYNSAQMIAVAKNNVRRTEGFLLAAAQDLTEELDKLLPDSAAAATGGES